MKKIISVMIVCLMAISIFASCGKEGQRTEPTTSPAIQDATTEAAPEESTSISRDYRSGQIMIDGNLITLPMRVSEFMALGWTPDDYDADYIIEAKSDIRTGEWENSARCDFVKGNNELDCSVYNWTDTDIALSDGFIDCIITDDDSNYSFVIPGDFEIGKATKDETLLITSFIINGILGIISTWLQDISIGTPEKMAATACSLIENGINGFYTKN